MRQLPVYPSRADRVAWNPADAPRYLGTLSALKEHMLLDDDDDDDYLERLLESARGTMESKTRRYLQRCTVNYSWSKPVSRDAILAIPGPMRGLTSVTVAGAAVTDFTAHGDTAINVEDCIVEPPEGGWPDRGDGLYPVVIVADTGYMQDNPPEDLLTCQHILCYDIYNNRLSTSGYRDYAVEIAGSAYDTLRLYKRPSLVAI